MILSKKILTIISALVMSLKILMKKFIKSLYPQNYEHFNKKGYKFISKLIYKKKLVQIKTLKSATDIIFR